MRWSFGVMLLLMLAGCPEPPPECVQNTDCNDNNGCTIDDCQAGVCVNELRSSDDANPCTSDTCDPSTGNIVNTPVDIDDNNACTTDACDPATGDISHIAVEIDDSDACTDDACDPATGEISNTLVNTSDNNECTIDECDSVTGDIFHTPIEFDDANGCTIDACDPATGDISHVLVSIDDQDVCTTDVCEPATGSISHTPIAFDDNNACTIDACDPTNGISHVAVNIDDGNGCTIDACDAATGNVSHVAVVIDDNNACTIDACDPTTGVVSNTAIAIDDGDGCTTDACDPTTGNVSHVAVVIDDNDACTVDSCDTLTGTVSHVAIGISDNIECTLDVCDPLTGSISHTPVQTACADVDGASCSITTCDPTDPNADLLTGCVDTPDDLLCDDGLACVDGEFCDPTAQGSDPVSGCVAGVSQDNLCDDNIACSTNVCVGASGDSNGCDFVEVDVKCAAGEFCGEGLGCTAAAAADQDGRVIITEFSIVGVQDPFVELTNVSATPIDLQGFVFENGGGQFAEIAAVNDLNGLNQTPVLLQPGSSLFGVSNPADGVLPNGAGFVFGEVGSSFSLSAQGDILALFSADAGSLEDYIDFRNFVTDVAQTVGVTSFPGVAGVSTQLDPSKLTAADNDNPLQWCLSFQSTDSAGTPNGSCSAFVINEVLYDFDHPVLGGTDDNRVFVELVGPGGGNLKGVKVLGVDGDNVGDQAPNVTIGVTAGVISATRMPLDGFFVIADGTANNTGTLVPNADLILTAGDPTNGNNNGDAVKLFAADGVLLDTLAYGTAINGEGSAVVDLDPDETAVSLARDFFSTDTNNNVLDFHLDPTPSPGEPNAPVVPTLVDVPVNNSLAGVTNSDIRIFIRDVGDLIDLNDVAPDDNDIDVSFAGNKTIDTVATFDGCNLIDITEEGRGIAELQCEATSLTADALRGDLVVENPAVFATDVAARVNGWTFTSVLNGTALATEVDLCRLVSPETLSVVSQQATDLIFGDVFESGVTDLAGFSPIVFAELGFGVLNTDPRFDTSWRFFASEEDTEGNPADIYRGKFTAPNVLISTDFSYTYRVSLDGGLGFTYCDKNGAGSDVGFVFEADQLGVMTVTP